MSAINASTAYANIRSNDPTLVPGDGVTVGVYDRGIEARHPIFQDTDVVEFSWRRNVNEDTGFYRHFHGTAVASVVVGTAPGVDLESYGLPTYYNDVPRLFDKLTAVDLLYINPYIESRMNFVMQRSIDILNVSVGYDGMIDEYDEDTLRQGWGGAIKSLAQAERNAEDRKLIVFAAGNAEGDACIEGGSDHCNLHDNSDLQSLAKGSSCSRRNNEFREYCLIDIEQSPHRLAVFGRLCEAASDDLCLLDPVSQEYRLAKLNESEYCARGSSDHCILDPDSDEHVYRYVSVGDECAPNTPYSSRFCVWDEADQEYRIVRGGAIDASSVEIFAGLMAHIEELRGHTVAVVAVAEDSNSPGDPPEIASFSNRCGAAADWCIAAPGDDITLGFFRLDNDPLSEEAIKWYFSTSAGGTSYAAPIVSGGLAILIQRFRGQMPTVDVLQRLFDTADKTGIYADTSIYGNGLMDLAAATEAVGSSSVAIGSSVEGASASLRSTMLSLGPAFGAGTMRSLANHEVVSFDSLGAPFWHDLSSLAAAPGQDLGLQLRRMLNEPVSGNSLDSPYSDLPAGGGARLSLAANNAGYLGIAGPALEMTWGEAESPIVASAFTTEGRGDQPAASGLSFSWKPLGLHAGLVTERESALGIRAEGGFGQISATSAFAGFERSRTVGSWKLDSVAEFGVTDPSAGQGILAKMDSAMATRFSLSAARQTEDAGQFRLALEQPLRVEHAPSTLWIPVGRTKQGEVLRERWQTDLAPSGRQVDLSAWWSSPTAEGGELRLGAVASRHPGHNADATSSISLLTGYWIGF